MGFTFTPPSPKVSQLSAEMVSQLKGEQIGSTIVTLLWIAGLFGAMWMGQNWARYAFISLIGISIVVYLALLGDVQQAITLPLLFWVIVLFHIIVFFVLIYSSAIRNLTKRH